MKKEQLIKSYLPMSEAGFLVLGCLRSESHGYAIMQQVSHITAGRLSLGASTVYTILNKMENDAVVEVVGEYDRRKVYRITEDGYAVLQAEAKRLLELAELAKEIVGNPIAVA